MPQITTTVTTESTDPSRLPDALSRYAALIDVLRNLGMLDRLAERLHLDRRHGYAGVDLFLFMLCFLCQREETGIRPFRERFAASGPAIAALGGRANWPTQGSISRAMQSLDAEQVEAFGEWVLDATLEGSPLRTADEVTSLDGRGRRWHIFDLDGTVTPFRQRALPEGEELPAPRRRLDAGSARAGYSGRKRGDIQLERYVLQHSGSSAWLGSWAGPGNGPARRAMENAARIAARWRTDETDVLLRFDGALCGVPAFDDCRRAGVHFLTRCARYGWLRDERGTAWLASADWMPVPDALSGPRREATDLGVAEFIESDAPAARRRTCHARIVASRFRNDGGRKGVGTVIDGWQYELYATDLDAIAWTAAEVVSTYYGRCGQENRFGQEDRELGLDRTFSYHLPGQHFGCIAGQLLWNIETALGARLVSLPPGTATPGPTERTEPCHSFGVSAMATSTGTVDVATSTMASSNGTEEVTPVRLDAAPRVAKQHVVVAAELAVAEWSTPVRREGWLARHPGWSWDPSIDRPRCPNGQPAKLHNVRRAGPGVQVEYRVAYGPCSRCPLRAGCTRSTAPRFMKEVIVRIAPGDIAGYASLEAIARSGSERVGGGSMPASRTRSLVPIRSSIALAAPTMKARRTRPVRPATLIPSELRRLTRSQMAAASCRVWVESHAPSPPSPSWIAPTADRRQRRRRTHHANLGQYALAEFDAVRVELMAPVPLAQLLGGLRRCG